MVKKMRRVSVAAALLVALALAVPASAASWRTYGSLRGDGSQGTSVSTLAPEVEDIQLGIYTYGQSRTIHYRGWWYCWRGSDAGSRSKDGRIKTQPRTWKWINLRVSNTRMDACNLGGSAIDLHGSTIPVMSGTHHKIKLRVR